MTPWPLLVFGVSFFLARVLQVFFLSAVWTYMREQEKNPQRRDIKHRMTAAVIASETTKRIKTPLPLSRLLLPGSFFPDGIITQFATKKWNHSESSTFQWADAPPPLPPLVMQPRAGEKPAVVSAGAEDDQVRGVHYLSACGPAGIKLPGETPERF